jgi:large subunit ribosomal protein L30e
MGKKQASESVNSKLALVMKSGKAVLGYSSTLKALRKGNLKAIFVASNTPSIVKAEINYYSLLANTNVYHYVGNNIDLGSACGRYHRVAVLGIADAGDSDILTLFESK